MNKSRHSSNLLKKVLARLYKLLFRRIHRRGSLCGERRIKTLRNDSLLVHGHIEYMTLILPEQQHVWQKALLPDDRIPVSLLPPKKNKTYQSTGQQKQNPKTLALTSRASHSISVTDNIIRTGTKKSILRHQQRHERWFAFSAHNRPVRTRPHKRTNVDDCTRCNKRISLLCKRLPVNGR